MKKLFKKEIKRSKKEKILIVLLAIFIAILFVVTSVFVRANATGHIGISCKCNKYTIAMSNARTVYSAAETALAECLAAGEPVDTASGNVNYFMSGTAFEQRIARELGQWYTGDILVVIDDSDNIIWVKWTLDELIGFYEPS